MNKEPWLHQLRGEETSPQTDDVISKSTRLVSGRAENQVWTNEWFTSSQNFSQKFSRHLSGILGVRFYWVIHQSARCEHHPQVTSRVKKMKGQKKKKSLNMLKAQILDTDDFLPLRPSGTLVLSMCMVLSGVFSSMQEKKWCFRLCYFQCYITRFHSQIILFLFARGFCRV